MERTPVESSNIRAVGYDPATQVLEVEFTSGAVYRYDGVPRMEHALLLATASKGGYFARAIKGHYPYARVGKEEKTA